MYKSCTIQVWTSQSAVLLYNLLLEDRKTAIWEAGKIRRHGWMCPIPSWQQVVVHAFHLNVEVLAEGGVVDGGVVHNAQPVPLAALASPHFAGPGLHITNHPFSCVQGTRCLVLRDKLQPGR